MPRRYEMVLRTMSFNTASTTPLHFHDRKVKLCQGAKEVDDGKKGGGHSIDLNNEPPRNWMVSSGQDGTGRIGICLYGWCMCTVRTLRVFPLTPIPGSTPYSTTFSLSLFLFLHYSSPLPSITSSPSYFPRPFILDLYDILLARVLYLLSSLSISMCTILPSHHSILAFSLLLPDGLK